MRGVLVAAMWAAALAVRYGGAGQVVGALALANQLDLWWEAR